MTCPGRMAALLGAAGALAVGGVAFAAAPNTGPSSSQSPYVVPAVPGVQTTSILTVGDAAGTKPDGSAYRMVGIPDGLGAFSNGDGTFTVLMNHELTNTAGVTRAHGAKGAFVSAWTIRRRDLKVLGGRDLIQDVATWNTATGAFNAPAKGVAFSRFCSADLPAEGAFYNRRTGLGFKGRIFMNGEESGVEGRAVAHTLGGTSYELPHLGKFSWENSLANPATGDTTVVVGTDDGTGGQVYVYVGRKRKTGNPVERAGLVGGKLYGVKATGFAAEDPATGIPSGTAFTLVDLGDVSGLTGAQLEARSVALGVTSFQRPEDASWNPERTKQLYLATTASFTGNSRLWRLNFANPADPAAGGTIDMLLDGSEGQRMLDNLTVDDGAVLLQEDPGNQAHIAALWRYRIKDDSLVKIAEHDAARYTPGVPGFLTQDEESSGIIPVDGILGDNTYLFVQQTHLASTDPELVEDGQLLAMRVPEGRR